MSDQLSIAEDLLLAQLQASKPWYHCLLASIDRADHAVARRLRWLTGELVSPASPSAGDRPSPPETTANGPGGRAPIQ